MRLVQAKQSRWKLSPDMRLSYAFDEGEKRDRLAAARARLEEVLRCRAGEGGNSGRTGGKTGTAAGASTP
jgi:hypothetical protein